MIHSRLHHIARTLAATALLVAGAASTRAADPKVVWVDNEHFGFTNCTSADVSPDIQDPKALMDALRARGLADAGRMARVRGFGESTITVTPLSGSIRCEGSTSAMVFRVTSRDAISGRSWSSNLVSRLPALGVPSSGLRSTR
jgi:hypothetical protein